MPSRSDKASAISWFPGHMAAGLRALGEVADLLDIIVEVRDARMPRSTAVATLQPKLQSKPLFVVLNRADLASPSHTRDWVAALTNQGMRVFKGSATRAATLRDLQFALLRFNKDRRVRAAVVGAPNTGKSSVINAIVKRKRATTRDKPGTTRSISWIVLGPKLDLLDTPGVLEPKITSTTAAWQLALCGILPDNTFDKEAVVAAYVDWVSRRPAAGSIRIPTLAAYASTRHMLGKAGKPDLANAAQAYISTFRSGAFGRVTFELPKTEHRETAS